MSDALINGLAGAGGGIIAQLITYPLQTVNTRQQTERRPKKALEEELLLASKKPDRRKTGTFQQMYQVVKKEGWGRLYSGLMPSLVGTAASQGTYYYFYQIFRSKAEALAVDRLDKGFGDGTVGMFSSLVVAALAGCVNVLFTNPIWVVVTRMQTHTRTVKKNKSGLKEEIAEPETLPFGTCHAVQEVYDEAGALGFWKGVFPALIMVSNPSMQFMLYETLLKRLKKRNASKRTPRDVSALEIFLLGAVAKFGATVVTYPLLVLKSRLQAKQAGIGNEMHRYEGTLDAVSKIMHYEGIGGFYKGMRTKIFQSVLAAAILFMVKEELTKAVRVVVTGRGGLAKKSLLGSKK